jgi:hypothetical protein
MKAMVDYIFDVTKKVIAMNKDKYVYFSTGELVEEENIMKAIRLKTDEENNERIQAIKAKASEIITSKYSIVWQLNHPRVDIAYTKDYEWIDNIREISNKAELNGTALENIDWGI